MSLQTILKETDNAIFGNITQEFDFLAFKKINSLFLQAILSFHCGELVQLSDLFFEELGKPYLNPEKFLDIHFNVSHTKSEVAIAVASFPIGFDLELIKENYPNTILNQLLNKDDQLKIESAVQFYQIWTIKEAFVKYTGQGLQFSLKNITVTNEDMNCLKLKTTNFYAEARIVNLLENHACFVVGENIEHDTIEINDHTICSKILLNFLSEKTTL